MYSEDDDVVKQFEYKLQRLRRKMVEVGSKLTSLNIPKG
jgi:hypothetical protein